MAYGARGPFVLIGLGNNMGESVYLPPCIVCKDKNDFSKVSRNGGLGFRRPAFSKKTGTRAEDVAWNKVLYFFG